MGVRGRKSDIARAHPSSANNNNSNAHGRHEPKLSKPRAAFVDLRWTPPRGGTSSAASGERSAPRGREVQRRS
eukprot:4078255-Pyramimonas_sp.AAC.1